MTGRSRAVRLHNFGRAFRRDERGMALVMVISVGSVIAIMLVAAIALSVGAVHNARNEESWNGALAAAYAGVEEYQSRIADDPTYYKYGNPASSFSPAGSVVAPPAVSPNPAFGIGATGTWASVAGSDNTASYRYEVDGSQYAVTGDISIRSTGRVGSETRTVVAGIRQQGFVDFLYFTDYEIQDPAFFGMTATEIANCVRYGWAGRPSTGCHEISFASSDTLAGPVHSNDRIRSCGATFTKEFTTAWTVDPFYVKKNSNDVACGDSTFSMDGYPTYSALIGMPATNSELVRETRSDLTAVDVPLPGCLYTGPTDIQFNDNGTVTVRSPWTKQTQTAGDPATSGTHPASCGTPGVVGVTAAHPEGTGLGSAGGATFSVPANNVMYVQAVPATIGNPNYWSITSFPATTYPSAPSHTLQCKGLDNQDHGNGIGYPMLGENTGDSSYGCRNGDAFVDGTLRGAVTIGAEQYVYVTGDIKYSTSSLTGIANMLGLVGNAAVYVWNPIRTYGGGTDSLLGANRRIDAAILSVLHTFQVQNYDKGSNQGTLSVTGAIAQKFRGVVRVDSSNPTGYAKNYVYDSRLEHTAPPKYLSPVTSTYGVTRWIEVNPAFTAAGAYSP